VEGSSLHPGRHVRAGRANGPYANFQRFDVSEDSTLQFSALKPETSFLEQLFILPAKQGQGIVFSLLQWAMRGMPTGFKLRAASTNQHARRFWRGQVLPKTFSIRRPGGEPYRFPRYDCLINRLIDEKNIISIEFI
jgi:hypothetical protein